MPSGPVNGESDGDVHILYPPAAGPGGGSSSRGRALSQWRWGLAFHILHLPLPILQRALAVAALSHLCRCHQHPQPLTTAHEPWLFTAPALAPSVASATAYISRHHQPSVPSPESLPPLLQSTIHCISIAS